MNKIIRELEIYRTIGGQLSENAEFIINFFEDLFENLNYYFIIIWKLVN